jgi:hypothetical protein
MGTTIGPANGQFLRFCQLVVLAGGNPAITTTSLGATSLGEVNGVTTFSTGVAETQSDTSGIDLSQLRIRFEVSQSDLSIPNTMTVRIYNVSQSTRNTLLSKNQNFKPDVQLPHGATPVNSVDALVAAGNAPAANSQQQHEYVYNRVILTAGYQNGNKGNIFDGQIITYRFGRESNVDSYLELVAADGDSFYNGAVVANSVPAGATPAQQVDALVAAGGIAGVSQSARDQLSQMGGIVNPRGKVSFGLGRLTLDKIARAGNVRWSIQNGFLTLVPVTGYLPSNVVPLITSQTGMIGTPEATDQGVVVRCYINPTIAIGQAIKLLSSEVNQTQVVQSEAVGGAITSNQFIANASQTGIYRVIIVEHFGDTRGQEWYSELTCLAIDPSSNTVQVATGGS